VQVSALLRLRLTLWLTILVIATGCGNSGPSFKSTDITGADIAGDFHLIDHNGQPRSRSDFRGKVLVVFFGFTHCPDVCPTTLSQLALALKRLGPEAERVQVVMITVDPERDTPEVLKQYVTALDPRFLGLTGDAAAIAEAAKQFKVFYQKTTGGQTDYSIDHSASSFVFDPSGKLRLLVSSGQGAEVYAHDIGELLRTAKA